MQDITTIHISYISFDGICDNMRCISSLLVVSCGGSVPSNKKVALYSLQCGVCNLYHIVHLYNMCKVHVIMMHIEQRTFPLSVVQGHHYGMSIAQCACLCITVRGNYYGMCIV